MNRLTRFLAPLFACALTVSAANAQFYKVHNADVTISGLGQFTTPLTSNYTGTSVYTTNTFGGLFSLREHPVSWAGVEVNYSYTDLQEQYFNPAYYQRLKTQAHEATAAYIFHPHFRKLQPFVNVGGGAIDFLPSLAGQNQWRFAGLLETGFDIPTSNPHFGFRVQGRTLIYRAPNYYSTFYGTRTWVSSEEPTLGAWVRF